MSEQKNDGGKAPTSPEILRSNMMDLMHPKTELEWWAHGEIKRLEQQLQRSTLCACCFTQSHSKVKAQQS